MEGDKKKRGKRTAGDDSGRIQEYDFFVSREGYRSEEVDQADQQRVEKKKVGRNKSMDFFLPE